MAQTYETFLISFNAHTCKLDKNHVCIYGRHVLKAYVNNLSPTETANTCQDLSLI